MLNFNSLEGLLSAIGSLSGDNSDTAAQTVAEAARKGKDLFESKVSDMEQMVQCLNMDYCSAVAVAMIKAMFDVARAKKSEEGRDKAVEIFKHFLDEGKFVKAHLRMVSDLFLPLAREIGFYCLKKNAEVAYDLTRRSLLVYLNEGENSVTSLHAAHLSAAIKTENYVAGRQFIYSPITAVISELSPSVEHNIDVLNRRSRCTAPPFFSAHFMLCYLYYGAKILIKLNELQRALQLLEVCITMPGSSASMVQMDAMKKYYIVSLMVSGDVKELQCRSASVMRAWKVKSASEAYVALTSAAQCDGNSLAAIRQVIKDKKSAFEKDENLELVNVLHQTLRKKAVVKVAKCFSSISLSDLARRSFCNEDEIVALLKDLVALGQIEAEIDEENKTTRLAIVKEPVTRASLEKKAKFLDLMRSELCRVDVDCQLNPSHLVRTMKGNSSMAFYQDDEGLSESASPMDA